jgi:hypothetical protein
LNILTKISIVLLVLLVLIACPVFLATATVGPNYRQAYESSEARNKDMELSSNLHQLAAQRAQADYAEVARKFELSGKEAQTKFTSLEEQVAAEKVKNAGFEAKLAGFEQGVTRLTGELQTAQSARDEAVKARDTERATVLKLQNENNQLSSTVQDLQSKLGSALLAVRALEEKNAQLQEMVKDLQDKVASGPARSGGAGEAVSAAGGEARLMGAVTGVDKDIVSVNIGSAKGMKKDTVLVIYRGDQFICHARMQQVDANESAGVIFDKKADPAQGDKAATSSALRN